MTHQPYRRLRDIPPFTRWSSYRTDVCWKYLEYSIDRWKNDIGVELDPDFQRGHVWTRDQQIAYVEHCLRGGKSTNLIHWNCHDWNEHTGLHPVQLVDGKQRITAALAFLHDELPAFGRFLSEYEDKLGLLDPSFLFHVNSLPTRVEVLQWYLELNGGGVVHTDEELERVRRLLAEEQSGR